jgi:23S rRNA pseudouridine1911/1915/1917 synthase
MTQLAPPVLYEDNHILVVVKPVNVPSQADQSGDPDLLTILKADLKTRYQKPGNVYLGLVHRLDRPVGGVMVFAKTSKAASRLSEQIRTREFHKTYLAVIHGSPEVSIGQLRHYLLKNQTSNTVQAFSQPRPESKEALLDFEVIERHDNLSLVRVLLNTGRSHQIRVQFAAISHPLYGDQKYGADLNKHGQQIALWSTELHFKHPTRDEAMQFQSAPPPVTPWNLFCMK